jgi:serine protease Do
METVTTGIVSAKWRKIGAGPYEDFIQTDASINPGNSGGPLFNMDGKVVGVNTMIYSTSGGNMGIGFAIPINIAKNVVRQLKEKGRVIRGWLGVVVQTVTPELAESFGLEEGKGALIADVSKGGPADKAGIEPGDVITKFDGKDVKEMTELPLMVAETMVGKKVKVAVLRDGKKKVITVKIGELEEKQAEKIAAKEKEDMGITVREITPELANRYGLSDDEGVIITYVEPGSPADEAGLRKGDIIKEINRKSVKTLDEYLGAIKDKKAENILVLVKRGGTSLWVVLKPMG